MQRPHDAHAQIMFKRAFTLPSSSKEVEEEEAHHSRNEWEQEQGNGSGQTCDFHAHLGEAAARTAQRITSNITSPDAVYRRMRLVYTGSRIGTSNARGCAAWGGEGWADAATTDQPLTQLHTTRRREAAGQHGHALTQIRALPPSWSRCWRQEADAVTQHGAGA